MSIKLIVLDLDGTLLKTKWKIHPKNIAMIKRVYQEKPEIKIIIATGRAPISTIPHAKSCLIDNKTGYIVCYNGGSIINIANDKQEVLFEKSLSQQQTKEILDFATKNKINIWGYATDNKTAYINHRSLKVWLVECFNKVKVKKLKNNEIPSFYKILLFCKKKNQVPKILEKLIAKKDLEVTTSSYSVIEVNPAGINKSEAVQFLAKKWNLQPEEILACGDGINDYKLLEWVKYGIAMDNASDELKKVAYGITTKNTEAGVAKAINKYVLS